MRVGEIHALVTGAGSGLGAATAERLARSGARVALLDQSREACARTAEAIEGPVLSFAADITRADQVSDVFESVRKEWGGLQVLVNCAGVGVALNTLGWSGPARLEDFARVIEVNLVGTFNCIRLAAALMAKNAANPDGERGVIVNTASTAAFEGQSGQSAYAASKAGIVGMTLPIARDLADLGIRVVTIAPGLFDTPMVSGLPEQVKASLVKQPLFPRRLGRADEFASLVAQVVENPMLNGTTIRLDAGIRMPPR